ncbi:MAG: hypothetical protein ABR973_14285 [Candidatus Acidiferrales bacterium]
MASSPNLAALARDRFSNPKLNSAEEELVRSAPNGTPADCSSGNIPGNGSTDDPSESDKWPAARTIRAELIRWLCVDRQAKQLVDPRGIRIYGARIDDPLDLSSVTVPFPLDLRCCRLMKELNLHSTEMPGLCLQGSWLGSLAADFINVKGAVFLVEGFHATGEVRLIGAQIGGDLDCRGAVLHNPAQAKAENGGTALLADGAVVKGSVFLNQGFQAEGTVRLVGAQIGGDLVCDKAQFDGALILRRASIKDSLRWLEITEPDQATLDVTDASVDTLVDDETSWPLAGKIMLDGFVYRRFSGRAPTDAKSRLHWLARQARFAPQPYRQLAKVFRDEGNASGARKVLFEIERLRRAEQARKWDDPPAHGILLRAMRYVWRCVMVPIWSLVPRWTVGYFYDPGAIALKWLAALIVVGTLLYYGGYTKRIIVPVDKDAYSAFKTKGEPPDYHGVFHPFLYSFENTFQLVKIGQADRWQPDPNPQGSVGHISYRLISAAELLGWFRWFQIVLGWFFTTMLISGFTDIVRKD